MVCRRYIYPVGIVSWYTDLLVGKEEDSAGMQDWAQLLPHARNKPPVFIRLQAKAPDEILY